MNIKILLLSSVLFLSGCATTYEVRTNGFIDPSLGGEFSCVDSSVHVLANPKAQNQLFDREIKFKIEQLLQRKGCSLASEAQAQYMLKFDYAIDKGVLKTGSVAEYYPGETTYTRGTVTGSSGTSTYTETNQNPGHTYFRPVSYTVYTRTLKTELTRDKEPVWIGETVSYGEDNDLRVVMDYLLVSNLKYLGKNTPNARLEAFTENSKEVKELRSGK